ncbi:ACT domain-containing protein [Staphylococcus pseudoxylosus]|uniref:ACT domain-containing protein n=1 Tax=Staphylococcus pseudoxylosus TaxID=2282419 RepID=UPI000D1D200E|nr:ACT domain-containing protein [Staphylococcus pseudoxylosus]PTI45643.1 ACT domain-containing protein [Staphylococcus xylosus]MDW8798564.1 ACT domain-containing protein [Staphylococcus pseudoxylosus]MEB6036016.1 ACT domain-containing protein [Staphylococcus pseudoxylosus]MEB6045309.1 ACT domain-containing protein [Staphylococcus pseudoxylosus]MEB6059735.1 ACT domain-containing protein [Staphylococcus pseudoxylosus]
MDKKDYKKFYLIREDVLPESVVKTLKIKEVLKNNPSLSIFEAVKQFDLSRSAFYKYRDTIFPIDEKMESTREFTLILYVNDIVGMLAEVLNTLSSLSLSVLTIHQSIPMESRATITLSLDAKGTNLEIDDVMEALRVIDHVSKVELISMTI